jgi:IS5 family transposase
MGRVLAGAHRHDSPLLASTLDQLGELGPLPEEITVHLDAGYDSGKTRDTLAARGLNAEIARKGEKAPFQAERWHVDGSSPRGCARSGCRLAGQRRRRSVSGLPRSPRGRSPASMVVTWVRRNGSRGAAEQQQPAEKPIEDQVEQA